MRAGLSRSLSAVRSCRLQYDCESLSYADADGREAVAAAAPLQLVGQRAEDACARATQRVPDGDGAAVDVHDLGVELPPFGQARERLRRERLVQLHHVDVSPRDAGALDRLVRRFHGTDAEEVRLHAVRGARHDARERLAAQLLGTLLVAD